MPPITGADVIQLERRGNTFIMSVARFGEPFTVDAGGRRSTSATRCTSGLFLCSHNPDVVEKAVFRNVRIIRPAKVGFVPYRDYIGSRLEILDVDSGHRAGHPQRRRARSRRRTGRPTAAR